MGRTVIEADFERYAGMVYKMARRVAIKMQPRLIGYSKIDEEESLNNRGLTFSDITQEMMLQVFFAISKYEEIGLSEKCTVLEASYVYRFLKDCGSKLIREMWADKAGEKFNHLQGDMLFGTEVSDEEFEKFKGKYA